MFAIYNYDLFCVNTNSHENSEFSNKIFKIVMEKLFPKETPYEIINYSLSSLAFNIIQQMKIKINDLEKKLIKTNNNKIKSDKLNLLKKNSIQHTLSYETKIP